MNALLVLNVGSTSLRFKLFRDEVELLAGHLDGIGKPGTFTLRDSAGYTRTEAITTATPAEAIAHALRVITTQAAQNITHVLHRVVHGGETFSHHAIVTPTVESAIAKLAELAPLHNPANLAGIRAAQAALPHAQHIAFFDTVFHHTIPRHAFLYGIPYRFYEKWGIRKYGFHGLSHQYLAESAYHHTQAHDRMITCHLGGGSSVCAVHHGKSLDTTMGFSPLDGLLMGTRTGELDPEIPLFLMERERLSIAQMHELLSKGSGLLGLVGTSDMREVKALADKGNEHARTAIEMLAYRVALAIGSYHVTVGGVRTIVFSGGIGENASYVRAAVCSYLKALGVLIDLDANEAHRPMISTATSRVHVMVIPANEELQMVRLFLRGAYR